MSFTRTQQYIAHFPDQAIVKIELNRHNCCFSVQKPVNFFQTIAKFI